jgi:hypothetical protein
MPAMTNYGLGFVGSRVGVGWNFVLYYLRLNRLELAGVRLVGQGFPSSDDDDDDDDDNDTTTTTDHKMTTDHTMTTTTTD